MITKDCMKEIETIFREYSDDFKIIEELVRKHNLPSYMSSSFREFFEQRVINKAVAEVIEKDHVRKSLNRQAENLKYFHECLIKSGFDAEIAKAIVIGGVYSIVEQGIVRQGAEMCEME